MATIAAPSARSTRACASAASTGHRRPHRRLRRKRPVVEAVARRTVIAHASPSCTAVLSVGLRLRARPILRTTLPVTRRSRRSRASAPARLQSASTSMCSFRTPAATSAQSADRSDDALWVCGSSSKSSSERSVAPRCAPNQRGPSDGRLHERGRVRHDDTVWGHDLEASREHRTADAVEDVIERAFSVARYHG